MPAPVRGLAAAFLPSFAAVVLLTIADPVRGAESPAGPGITTS